MTFEYLTPEEVAEHGLSPEEAEWEEAARKREAISETIQAITAQLKANARTMERILERLQERDGGPNLVLVETETDDDA